MEKAPVHHHKKKVKRAKVTSVPKEKEVKSEEIKDNNNSEEEINVEDEIEKIFNKIKAHKQKKKIKESEDAENQKKAREKGRKYTEDGLPIYTEEELGIYNPKAGTTPLCPFDCDCCH